MKLNLGCGKRLMDGYINIDVEPREGVTVGDARKLEFEDNCADEIISIHMFEHFWPWETQDILKEWLRVLKLDGMLVIECPNLRSAATFLTAGWKSGNERLITAGMNALYGDPKDRELPGRHKWGYTPDSLIALVSSCGFREARQMPAEFKMKDLRDMRVVAWK